MFLFSSFLQGLEFTTILATLWSYSTIGMPNWNPDLSYGLIASGRFVAPLLFGSLVARWFDKRRMMRRLMLIVAVIMNIGYALYLIHPSPYVPMIGTVLQGSSFILRFDCVCH